MLPNFDEGDTQQSPLLPACLMILEEVLLTAIDGLRATSAVAFFL